MAGLIPAPPKKGDKILPWATSIQTLLPYFNFHAGWGLKMTKSSAGISIAVDPAVTESSSHPFQIVQAPASEPPEDEDWRTFIVRAGLVNNIEVLNTDACTTPAPLTFTANTSSEWYFWVDSEVVVTGGATQGNIKNSPKPLIVASDDPAGTGWAEYPGQPEGNSETGEPPPHVFILIGKVVVGTDEEKTVTYHQYITTQLGVQMFVIGSTCSSTDGRIDLKRMVWFAAS